MHARAMEGTSPAPNAGLNDHHPLGRQLLPLLCCLAIQAMWLGVIRGLEGVLSPPPTGAAQARPSLNL
jgi:hypothetical protein